MDMVSVASQVSLLRNLGFDSLPRASLYCLGFMLYCRMLPIPVAFAQMRVTPGEGHAPRWICSALDYSEQPLAPSSPPRRAGGITYFIFALI
eukprot:357276-Chlamydomonas_euryale.AAC.3